MTGQDLYEFLLERARERLDAEPDSAAQVQTANPNDEHASRFLRASLVQSAEIREEDQEYAVIFHLHPRVVDDGGPSAIYAAGSHTDTSREGALEAAVKMTMVLLAQDSDSAGEAIH
jgi:hypothetical protein